MLGDSGYYADLIVPYNITIILCENCGISVGGFVYGLHIYVGGLYTLLISNSPSIWH